MRVKFIETDIFTADAARLLSDDGLRSVQNAIMANPKVGQPVGGTGGARKVRLAMEGRGKSFGARVIFFADMPQQRVFMLAVYSKAESSDLTKEGARVLKELLEQLRSSEGG